MKTIIATLSLLGLVCSSLVAEEVPRNIQIDTEFIELPESVINGILHDPKPPKSGSEWRGTVDRLLKNGTAKVKASLSVTTKTGQRATAESVREITYTTEFDPANGRAANSPAVPVQVTGSDIPTPTSFEMRPVGMIVEAEATVGTDGKTIDINIAPELVHHVGETTFQEIPLGTQMQATVKQPIFHRLKATSSVTIINGGSALLGILIPHNDAGENDNSVRVLCMVTARLMNP